MLFLIDTDKSASRELMRRFRKEMVEMGSSLAETIFRRA